jgi:hypothetical protein
MAPSSHTIDFRPTDVNQKKIALLAVVSFNDANNVPYNRGKLYEYFDINVRTAQKWCAAASASASAPGAAQQPGNAPEGTGPRGIKRDRLEDAIDAPSSASAKSGSQQQPAVPARQHASQNGAQGRKKRKAKDEVASVSPPPPRLLTMRRQNIAQPRKQRNSHSGHQTEGTESFFDLGGESWDEDIAA